MNRFIRSERRASVHLVLFATEGPPFDRGIPLLNGAQVLKSKAEPHFTTVTLFTPRILSRRNADWVKTLEDIGPAIRSDSMYSPDMPWNEDWARIGNLLWKPRLLSELSRDHLEGDIVMYHDVNLEKYPEYLRNVDRWSSFVTKALRGRHVLLFRDRKTPLSFDVKPELTEALLPNCRPDELSNVWAGALAFRCSQEARSFLDEWKRLCEIKDYLSPTTRARRDNHFYWHTGEQAILATYFHLSRRVHRDRVAKVVYLRESREIPPRNPISFLAFLLGKFRYRFVKSLSRASRRLLGKLSHK